MQSYICRLRIWYVSFFLLSTTLLSQTIIKGRVSDKATGKPLVSANVFLENKTIGSATDKDGLYRISLPDNIGVEVIIIVEYIGYESDSAKISITSEKSLTQNFELLQSPLQLQNVLVTANRIEQNLQDVSIAATAIDATELRYRTANMSWEALAVVPNLSYDFNITSQVHFTIRGFTSNVEITGIETGIAMYVDDVYIPRAYGLGTLLLDVERLEVMRGPQGTMFGKNAIGGVVQMVSAKPAMRNFGSLELVPGNFNALLVRGGLNTMLVENKLALTVSGAVNRRNLWIENLNVDNPQPGHTLNWGLKGALLWKINPNVDFTLRGIFSKDDKGETTVEYIGKPEGSPWPGVDQNGEDRIVDTDAPNIVERELYNVSGYFDIRIGQNKLTSITAATGASRYFFNDLDYTRFNGLTNGSREKFKTFSQEIRFTSGANKKFSYQGGLYYLNEQITGPPYVSVHPELLVLLGVTADDFFETASVNSEIKTHSFAPFFSGSYRINEHWRLSGGLRYTIERKKLEYSQEVTPYYDPTLTIISGIAVPLPAADSPEEILTREAEDNEPSGDIGLDYRFNQNIMTYGKFTRGFKGGGFNASFNSDATGGNLTFEPERVNSIEAGIKSIFADNRIRLNVALFYQDYQNKQEALVGATGVTVATAEEVDGYGFELETSSIIYPGLQADLSIGYLNMTFKKFMLGDEDLSGNRVDKSPDWTVAFSPQYRTPIFASYQLLARIDLNYTGKSYNDLTNSEVIARRPVTLVNGRIGLSTLNDRYSLALWGKNLTDETFALFGWEFFWGDQLALNPPRMFGLEFRLNVN